MHDIKALVFLVVACRLALGSEVMHRQRQGLHMPSRIIRPVTFGGS
jgi:hypothetical protein